MYEPATGRFQGLDSYAGNLRDPQSLHKYLYTHADPVNNVDPTGKFLGAVGGLIGLGIGALINRGVSSRYNAQVAATGTATVGKLLAWAYTARYGIPLLTAFGGYLVSAFGVTAANPLKVIWTGPGAPTPPNRSDNIKLSDWIQNVESAMVAHLNSRDDITPVQRNEGISVAHTIATEYVKSVQEHAIKTFKIEDADGVNFGKNGSLPGWTGNWLDGWDNNGSRDCDTWATMVHRSVNSSSGWKVERVEDALKAGDLALGLLFKHNFVLLKFDPNNTEPKPAFVLDPWIDARPEIWDFETFDKLWPTASATRVY